MQKLSMAALGAVFIALGTGGTAPATAAPLDFSFTTASGATGSFTLETDTAPGSEPALFGDPTVFGPLVLGISYPNAISNFSLSAPNINLSGETADFDVAPGLTSDILGLSPGLGVLSGAVLPSGCSTGNFSCLLNVAVIYSGNVSELPVLSDDPNSYSTRDLLSVDFFDPTTQQLLNRDLITNLQVVPEPSSVLGKLTFGIGIGGALLLLKRKMNSKVSSNKTLVELLGVLFKHSSRIKFRALCQPFQASQLGY